MKNFDDDATLSDVIEVAGYTLATPYNPRIRVLSNAGAEFRFEVIGLDYDGDTNTVDVIVARAD